MTAELVSVVIPTRNRPQHFPDCVEAVLANDDGVFEVIVVDQSDDDATAKALAEILATCPQVRYYRQSERGVARARNLGWRSTDAPLIAYTDDDCRVPPSWISSLRLLLADKHHCGIVFAGVHLRDDVGEGEFGSSFTPTSIVYDGVLPGPKQPWGISANMLVKSDVLEQLGGFDEALGAGGLFRSGAESDLTIRATGRGYMILHSPGPSVLHLGVRDAASARGLMAGYAFGMGATLTKHLRLRSRPGATQLPRWIAHYVGTVATNLALGRRPLRVVWLEGLLRGAYASFRKPIDRHTGLYLSDEL
jgi:GT2 family glycosyltransferase